jgi:hypothetical protein
MNPNSSGKVNDIDLNIMMLETKNSLGLQQFWIDLNIMMLETKNTWPAL